MSQKQVSLSSDLKRLQDDGLEIKVRDGLLLVYGVPYVNSRREVAYGILVSELTLAGDITTTPGTHVVNFAGEHPCNNDGSIIKPIQHATQDEVKAGITTNHSFSNKPTEGYSNYHQKLTNYIEIISAPAKSIDPSVTAYSFNVIESDEDESVFNYIDTNSSRADINTVSVKLKKLKIGIVGLGGTGSYVLDFIAKTPVQEIHLFDEDTFLQHNAFRAPGAPSVQQLQEKIKKVHYLSDIYSKMRKNIIPHTSNLNSINLEEVSGLDFVFICIDEGVVKKIIVDELVIKEISFIDVGIGVDMVDGSLRGSARVTLCTPEKKDHLERRIPFSDTGNDDYSQNVQIAELNALDASLAVIKWKKIYGYYHDMEKEYNAVYNIDVNQLVTDENNS